MGVGPSTRTWQRRMPAPPQPSGKEELKPLPSPLYFLEQNLSLKQGSSFRPANTQDWPVFLPSTSSSRLPGCYMGPEDPNQVFPLQRKPFNPSPISSVGPPPPLYFVEKGSLMGWSLPSRHPAHNRGLLSPPLWHWSYTYIPSDPAFLHRLLQIKLMPQVEHFTN